MKRMKILGVPYGAWPEIRQYLRHPSLWLDDRRLLHWSRGYWDCMKDNQIPLEGWKRP